MVADFLSLLRGGEALVMVGNGGLAYIHFFVVLFGGAMTTSRGPEIGIKGEIRLSLWRR